MLLNENSGKAAQGIKLEGNCYQNKFFFFSFSSSHSIYHSSQALAWSVRNFNFITFFSHTLQKGEEVSRVKNHQIPTLSSSVQAFPEWIRLFVKLSSFFNQIGYLSHREKRFIRTSRVEPAHNTLPWRWDDIIIRNCDRKLHRWYGCVR